MFSLPVAGERRRKSRFQHRCLMYSFLANMTKIEWHHLHHPQVVESITFSPPSPVPTLWLSSQRGLLLTRSLQFGREVAVNKGGEIARLGFVRGRRVRFRMRMVNRRIRRESRQQHETGGKFCATHSYMFTAGVRRRRKSSRNSNTDVLWIASWQIWLSLNDIFILLLEASTRGNGMVLCHTWMCAMCCTGWLRRIHHRIWRETKLQPSSWPAGLYLAVA